MPLEATDAAVITAVNPANREELGRIRVSSPAEIEATVRKAHQAQRLWQSISLARRLAAIESFRQLLFANREEMAALITRETGKPRVEALVAEIFGVLETCSWLRNNARKVLAAEAVQLNALFLPGKRCYNVFEPLGVVVVISPWNYPFSIPLATIIAAIAAGNAVVWKPSPKCALVAKRAWELLQKAGLPPDLIGLVQGDREQAEKLLRSDIQRVTFTGSTSGGKAIAAMAAEKLLPVTLELGGKHAAIVLDDSDAANIARPLVWAAFTNAGQACASIERMYITSEIKQKLLPLLVEQTKNLRLGDGLRDDVDVGPLIDEAQVQRVESQIRDAVEKGGRVLTGGRARLDLGGFFFEPTIIDHARPGMRIMDEEIFGPVLPIVDVDDEREAVRQANASPLGLGASIWTRDTDRAEQLARLLHAGMVWINDGLYTHVSPDAPWGGIKDSGYGRMHSAVELRDLVYIKNIGVNKQQEQVWNYPYSQAAIEYIRGGIEFVHGAASGKVDAMRKIGAALRRLRK
jgi:succinate-semialdehyde dehydrogenase/glutarate-semialdehyde dehydrogenase